MTVAPGQSPSGYGREMRGRFRRAGGAIAQIVTAHFLADFEQVAMDPQDVAAHIDKRHLRLGEAQAGPLAGLSARTAFAPAGYLVRHPTRQAVEGLVTLGLISRAVALTAGCH